MQSKKRREKMMDDDKNKNNSIVERPCTEDTNPNVSNDDRFTVTTSSSPVIKYEVKQSSNKINLNRQSIHPVDDKEQSVKSTSIYKWQKEVKIDRIFTSEPHKEYIQYQREIYHPPVFYQSFFDTRFQKQHHYKDIRDGCSYYQMSPNTPASRVDNILRLPAKSERYSSFEQRQPYFNNYQCLMDERDETHAEYVNIVCQNIGQKHGIGKHLRTYVIHPYSYNYDVPKWRPDTRCNHRIDNTAMRSSLGKAKETHKKRRQLWQYK